MPTTLARPKYITVPAVPASGDAEGWQPGSPGYSYDPDTVGIGSDGRYYALTPEGNLQMIASANGESGQWGMGPRLQEGPKAAETRALVEQGFANQGDNSFFGDMRDLLSGGFSALKEAAPGIALVAGTAALAGAFGGPALSGTVGGSEAGAWTSGYDLAGGGAIEGWGAGAGTAGGWTSGYDLPMGELESWGAPGYTPGVDRIGSDWAIGEATGPTGGLLPTTTGGLTAANLGAASGIPGSVNSGLPDFGAPGATDILKQLGSTASPSGLGDWAKLLGPLMSVGSGLYGLDKAKDLGAGVGADTSAALAGLQGLGINPVGMDSAAVKSTVAAADPWTASGGRALADTQLQALMRDPAQVAATDPAYALRIQAAQRAMGGYGQDSGAMAVAGANASTDWLNQRQLALANLENMGNPVGAQQVGLDVSRLGLEGEKAKANLEIAKAGSGLDAAKLKLAAQMGANSLAGQSLASLGFGVTQATGGNTTIPPQVLQYLQQLGGRV